MEEQKSVQSGRRRKVADDEPRIEYVPLSEMKKWPRNPKKHDIPGIIDSMYRFGFVELPVRDEKTGRLVAGHGRDEALETAKAQGMKPPKRIRARVDGEWLVPVLCGLSFESEQEAEAYLIASNQGVMKSGWDDSLLGEMLERHRENLVGTFYSENEVDALLAEVTTRDEPETAPAERPIHAPEEFREVDMDVTTSYCCPSCGYQWNGKAK